MKLATYRRTSQCRSRNRIVSSGPLNSWVWRRWSTRLVLPNAAFRAPSDGLHTLVRHRYTHEANANYEV